MKTIYPNTIEKSPFKKVTVDDDKGIALYGKSGKELTLKNKVYIDNFFNFIGKKHHILQVVTPEINEAIQNWSTQYINRLKYKGLEEYNRMGEIIEQKLREAREEDKNLLVVLGEEHECRDPQFFQLLLVDICLTKGIKNLLLEESSVEAYSPKWNATITYYAYNHLFWNVISNSMLQQNISLHPIDPLHEQYGERKVSPLSRDKAILKSILEVGKDAIVVVGGAHMVDFMKNDELKKYKLAIFHSANRAYSKEYKNKSPQQLEKSLKNLESVVSAAEHKIQEELNPCNVKKNKSYLDKQFGIYEENTAQQLYLMKEMIPQEITTLFLIEGQANAIPSDTNALHMAIDIISKNNPDTNKFLKILQYLGVLYEKMGYIKFEAQCHNADFSTELDYLSNPKAKLRYEAESTNLNTGLNIHLNRGMFDAKSVPPPDLDSNEKYTLESHDKLEWVNHFEDTLIGNEIYNSDITSTFYPKE